MDILHIEGMAKYTIITGDFEGGTDDEITAVSSRLKTELGSWAVEGQYANDFEKSS